MAQLHQMIDWAAYCDRVAIRIATTEGYACAHPQITLFRYSELLAAAKTIRNAIDDLSENSGVVGVLLEDDDIWCLIPSIIGILTSGRAFVYLPTDETVEYFQQVCRRVRVGCIVTTDATLRRMSDRLGAIERRSSVVVQSGAELQLLRLSSCGDDEAAQKEMAYAVCTSGSTGPFKVVRVPHACIVPNIVDLRQQWDVSRDDVVLLSSPLTFDPSIVEMFVALSSGATLLVPPRAAVRSPERLRALLSLYRASMLQLTPTLLDSLRDDFLAAHVFGADSPVRVLALGGEPFPSVRRLRSLRDAANQTRLFNVYGVTEVSCWATCRRVHLDTDDAAIDIGEPLVGTECVVRGVDGRRLDGDGCGELFVGGAARRCFIDEESQPAAMRSTGDRVRRLHGSLFLLGRTDHQVKRNGKRVDLAAVERVLSGCQSVSAVCVVFDTRSSALHCVFVGNTTDAFKGEEALRLAASSLPSHARPLSYWPIDTLPRTAHGKLNRQSLLRWVRSQASSRVCVQAFAPDAVEPFLIRTLKDYFGVVDVQSDTRLSDLGCDSLTAVHVATLLEEWSGRRLPAVVGGVLDRLSSVASLSSLVVSLLLPRESSDCGVVKKRRASGGEADALPWRARMAWRVDLGKCVDAAAVFCLDGSQVCIGSHAGTLSLVRVSDGAVLWKSRLPDRLEAAAAITADERFIVIGCFDGRIYTIERETGEIWWSFPTKDACKCVAVCDRSNIVFVGSHDGFVYSADVLRRAVLWSADVGGAVLSRPALDCHSQTLFVATLRSSVLALHSASGAVRWRSEMPSPVFGHLSVAGGVLLVSCVDGSLRLLDGADGSAVARVDFGGALFAGAALCPPVANSVDALVSSNVGDLRRLRLHSAAATTPASVSTVWAVRLGRPLPRAPTLCCEGVVAVVSASGELLLVDFETGRLLGSHALPDESYSAPIATCDGRLMVGCRDNSVYAFDLHRSAS